MEMIPYQSLCRVREPLDIVFSSAVDACDVAAQVVYMTISTSVWGSAPSVNRAVTPLQAIRDRGRETSVRSPPASHT